MGLCTGDVDTQRAALTIYSDVNLTAAATA